MLHVISVAVTHQDILVTLTLQDVCLWISNPRDFFCLKLSETNTLDSDHRSVKRTPRRLYTSETTSLRGTVREMSDRFTPHISVMALPNTKQNKKNNPLTLQVFRLSFKPYFPPLKKKCDIRNTLMFIPFQILYKFRFSPRKQSRTLCQWRPPVNSYFLCKSRNIY